VYKPVFHRVHNNPKQRQALCRARLALATFEYEAVSKTPLSFAKRKGYAIGCRGTDCPMACTVRLAQPRRLPSRVSVSKRDAPRATAAAGGGCSDAATQRERQPCECVGGREGGCHWPWPGRGGWPAPPPSPARPTFMRSCANQRRVVTSSWYPTHQPGSGAGTPHTSPGQVLALLTAGSSGRES
jgi:hypothetical protein